MDASIGNLRSLEDMIFKAAPGCPGDARAKLGWILDVNRQRLKALKKVKKVQALRAELNEADCAHHRVKEELKDLKKALGQLYRGESPCVCDSY